MAARELGLDNRRWLGIIVVGIECVSGFGLCSSSGFGVPSGSWENEETILDGLLSGGEDEQAQVGVIWVWGEPQ